MKFRKRPIVIDAIQYVPPLNCFDVWKFLGWEWPEDHQPDCDNATPCYIHTLEGLMEASPGDWIVKGVEGEFYPVKPDVFAATYESAEPLR
jgi:hypothetical protein